jgi:hypothetical protein
MNRVRDAATTFVIGDRLPWPDDGLRARQAGGFDNATLIVGGERAPCDVLKVSAMGATLRADVAAIPGAPVAVEFDRGRRCPALVDWARGGHIGVRFGNPIDILALINRNLVAQPVERRAMPRIELRSAVHLKWGEHLAPAVTRNVSARGMQVEGEDLPDIGTYTNLYVDGLAMPPCEVVWRQSTLAGVEFFEELSWSSLIPWVRERLRSGALSD